MGEPRPGRTTFLIMVSPLPDIQKFTFSILCSQHPAIGACLRYDITVNHPRSLNWAHTLETQKGERGWKKGNQQVRRMRKPKEKRECQAPQGRKIDFVRAFAESHTPSLSIVVGGLCGDVGKTSFQK
ncbi:hypothetical protein E5288_WYG006928 [Bos mutus]|uniref:Uncharacterized protein n=1 Tax=Bos mutus TaxID=72004 RepID=A0A6B0QPF2_9CETA|nr:hypothetical protein [Bos mutus]